MRAPVIAVLLAGCGGSPGPTQPAKAAAPSCTASGARLVELVSSQMDPAPPDDAVNELIALVRERCEQDGWSVDARHCLGGVRTVDDADRCWALLSEAQKAAIAREPWAITPHAPSGEVPPAADDQ
jgi:hypothetical protein